MVAGSWTLAPYVTALLAQLLDIPWAGQRFWRLVLRLLKPALANAEMSAARQDLRVQSDERSCASASSCMLHPADSIMRQAQVRRTVADGNPKKRVPTSAITVRMNCANWSTAHRDCKVPRQRKRLEKRNNAQVSWQSVHAHCCTVPPETHQAEAPSHSKVIRTAAGMTREHFVGLHLNSRAAAVAGCPGLKGVKRATTHAQ